MFKRKLIAKSLSFVAALGILSSGVAPASAASDCVPNNHVDLSGCDFSNRDFFNYVLDGSDFSNVNFSNSYARYSYWAGTKLDGANLTNAVLYSAYMVGATFIGTNLTGANLARVNLDGADLTDANLTGVVSGGITGTPLALPTGWGLLGGYLVGPGADLRGANLTGLDLTGIDLTGANLNGVRSGDMTGTPIALPTPWQFAGGYLFGPGADLVRARLDGLDLWDLDLTGANLTGASINQASIIYSTLTGVKSGGLVGTFQQISGARVQNGYILVPSANLVGADLRGADLSSLNLTACDLTGADLTNANLTGTDLSRSIVINTNFTFAHMNNSYLTGTQVSFSKFNGADLSGANLFGSTFLASEFYRSQLTNTNFEGSTITSTRSGDIVGEPVGLPAGVRIVDGEFMNYFTQNLKPVLSGDFSTGKQVIANITELPSDADVTYQWLRNSSPIQGANTVTYLVTAADVGKPLSVLVSISKHGFVTTYEVSDSATPSKSYISAGTVNISGVMKAGKVIKAITRPWVTALGVKIKYQWLRNGKEIKYATKSTYKLTAADSGAKIRVRVTQSLSGYYSATKTSPTKKITK